MICALAALRLDASVTTDAVHALEGGAESKQVRVSLDFRHAVPSILVDQLGLGDVTVTALTYRWGDQKAIYLTLPGDSIETMAAKFATRLDEILVNDPSGIADVDTQLAELHSRGLGISAIEIEGSRDAIVQTLWRIESSGHASLIETVDGDGGAHIRADASFIPKTLAGQPYPDQPWKFSPSSGSVTHNPTTKTITSAFRWNDVSGFDSIHKGYEHDIYVKGLVGLGVGPDSLYWSDLPAWYIEDTTSDFTKTILSVGTDAAPSIKVNTTYNVKVGYTLAVWNYNGQPGRMDVQPQLGSWAGTYDEGEWPSEQGEKDYCFVHWSKAQNCIFADQTNINLKYYENLSSTSAIYVLAPLVIGQPRTLYWDKNITTASKTCNNSQYRAEYFKDNTSLDGNALLFVRCESSLSQNWGYFGPEPDMSESFSARWTRDAQFAEGRYRFTATHDDGMRVNVDGVQRLNEWYDQFPRTTSFDLNLGAGTHKVVSEYYERTGTSAISLNWQLLAPAAPQSLGASFTSNQVRLSWTDTFGEQSYAVDMRPSNGTWSQVGTVGANTTSWTVPLSFSPGRSYIFRIRSSNTGGYSPYSNEATVTVPGSSPVTVLYESAETGAPGWSLGSGWIIQTSTASAAGSRRFLIGNGTSYWNNMNTSLTSPAVSLANRTSVRVTFAYKYDIEANYDFFWVELSPDNGSNWTAVTPKWTGLSPAGANWSRADLTFYGPYAGKSSVKIRFRFTSDNSIYRWGAAVDDIRITAQ